MKHNQDPPAQCHGAQTDPPVPALRFCGQLAQWTGNSTNYQGASVQVTLMGFAVSEDRTAELRRHLEILEGVQTRERSSSLVEFLMGSPEEERERQESGEMDPADQSLGRDFADDQTFTDFTPFEEEAYSAAFGSFSVLCGPGGLLFLSSLRSWRTAVPEFSAVLEDCFCSGFSAVLEDCFCSEFPVALEGRFSSLCSAVLEGCPRLPCVAPLPP
ncbi:hypothetical protein D4764_0184870 [Takifugu flavidus]|uniref:Uncharacterized protein n=1 Tax=Takifugu flavidus TaxID=433684 RepID=A0A5C6MEQ1_9TELE|nr:hypothetical protein D4764_0184870 [Takifugu flavidus]